MPELPEMEAWRRALDDPVSAFPVEKAGPAHIATLKTFDPPLSALEGRRFHGAERRGKRLLFPTDDGELVLLVHLMTAGRLRYVAAGGASPKWPAPSTTPTAGPRAARPWPVTCCCTCEACQARKSAYPTNPKAHAAVSRQRRS